MNASKKKLLKQFLESDMIIKIKNYNNNSDCIILSEEATEELKNMR